MEQKENNKYIPIGLLGLSCLVSLIYSYFLSFTERGLPIGDPYSIVFNIAWLSVLMWLAWNIYNKKKGAEKSVLFVACLVAAFTLIDVFDASTSILLVAISIIESGLLFIVYFYIKSSSNTMSS
ncbi:MAG: hypothetical protein KZQ99_19480 [Candidatus Thiodiazotropha sp. (ex Dulcina madagascariensis)]|nr:hypothetical protein [Candidatus Thiodiazotropha sp. (ex Dulcina madagascariensis)]